MILGTSVFESAGIVLALVVAVLVCCALVNVVQACRLFVVVPVYWCYRCCRPAQVGVIDEYAVV